MPPFTLSEVTAAYGETRVLGPLSLRIEPGERVALVGRSGAGKSTLLSLMYEHWREQAALMPQELGLVQSLSVFHNVFIGRLARHSNWYNLTTLIHPRRADVTEVSAILERLTIGDKVWARAGELSGGQRQRAAVARVLYQQAGILLADEPVSALDGPKSEIVMALMTEAYPTAVLAMHDVELALRYTDRVVGISGGHIVIDEASARLTPQDLQQLY